MGSSRSTVLRLAVAILSLWSVGGCGGGSKSGSPIFPAKVNLTPGGNTSVELGATFGFSAAAQSASGTNISTTFTYTSSDTSVLNLAPNGVACAGHWDVAFTTCTPGGIGVAQVTASALGLASAPTYVFVHPPVDSITVNGILLNGLVVQEPCLSQSQSMTVEAHAFSQGTDVTAAVGPFTWTAENPSVVNLVPLVNTAYNFATNQAMATAATPGMTQIYASASGVNSSSFHQPQYQNSQGSSSPSLDFFETCPIQTINLQIGPVSQQTSQTSFVTSKTSAAASVTATAIVTDVMGNSSLANTNSGIVLSKIPLTWSATQPGVVAAATTCQQSCGLTIQGPGSGFVTASCSPPSCNVGFPVVPSSLSNSTELQNCTQFFAAQYPQFQSCEQLIPFPVYATPLTLPLPPPPQLPPPPLPGDGSISGLVTGAPAAATVVATSTGCAHVLPSTCTTALYSVSTGKATPGPENSMSSSPNSLLFDLTGDRAYAGSDFGALQINPANFGSSNPFTGLDTVTGQVLAVSNNGSSAVFSDTIHVPNQVYIVNTSSSGTLSATALNISGAVAASISPDGLKAFIFGNGGSSLYVYSSLQALQGPFALSGPANANTAAFSPNGAFAFVAEAAANGNPANLTAFNTCNNQIAESPAIAPNPPVPAVLNLPFDPFFVKILPGVHVNGADSSGQPFPDGVHILVLDATGFNIITANATPPASGTLCPETLTFVSNPPLPMPLHAQRVELGQGNLQPINLFPSPDGTLLYILAAGHASVLVYDFGAGSITSAIDLAGNATPLSAGVSVDGGTIAVAGSDGLLHEVSTSLGGSDQVQLSFPNLPNYVNPFCSFGTCGLNLVAVKP